MVDDELASLMRRIRLVAFDFDGVFTDNTVLVSEDGTEHVRCWRGDGIGLRLLEKLGVQAVVISAEENPVVGVRCQKLQIPYHQGVRNKRAVLETVLVEAGLTLEQVAFVGNDVNDRDCLAAVALPIVVRDAHPSVLPLARLRTVAPGGYGAVREICDLFVAAYARSEP